MTRTVTIPVPFLLLIALLLLLAPGKATAEPRLALVIGNGAYQTGPLPNAVNDANAMAEALRGAGFEINLLTDADQQAMEQAIATFADALTANKGVGFFYYSGHGVQVAGENYMLPIGASLTRESEVKFKAVNLGMVSEAMAAAGNELNVLVLDACRNNPLQASGRSVTRGLARVDGGNGLFVSFATSPGAVALDGEGSNSPYTKHLVEAIRTQGLSLEETFKRTLKGTYMETKGQQTPWISSSFFGDFAFHPGSKPAADAPVVAALQSPSRDQVAARDQGLLALAGIYRAEGVNPNGSTYRGMAAVTVADGAYRVTWWIGKDVFHGSGRLGGRMLIVDWGSTAPAVYVLTEGGVLDGEWADGRGADKLTPYGMAHFGDAPDIEGEYAAEGRGVDGSPYTGSARLTRDGDGYLVEWDIGGSQYEGRGTLDGNLLTVDWGSDSGPIVYAVAADGSLAGLWSAGFGEELLTPTN